MTDPAVAYQPGENYGTFDRGVAQDIFLKNPNGSVQLGVVWPGQFQRIRSEKLVTKPSFRRYSFPW